MIRASRRRAGSEATEVGWAWLWSASASCLRRHSCRPGSRRDWAPRIVVASITAFAAACGGPPCRTQPDCPLGFHCVLEIAAAGAPRGECRADCFEHADCPQPGDGVFRAVCTNEGRCRTEARPPRLSIFEPEADALLGPGTRGIRVTGEVRSAAPSVDLEVATVHAAGCGGSLPLRVTVPNPNPGTFASIPFVVDGVLLDPGRSSVLVRASVEGSTRSLRTSVEVPCPGCPELTLGAPVHHQAAPGLELPLLAGRVWPPAPALIWRVHGSDGSVFDGVLPVEASGAFSAARLPLFAGRNRLEVVTGGEHEARCSVLVASSEGTERGLRALLTWDAPGADLDLHLIGPGGRWGDLATTLSARSRTPLMGGAVRDGQRGGEPELLTLDRLAPGSYGLVVEPVLDGHEGGASAFLRLLVDGRLVMPTAAGPQFLAADRGELWVVGVLEVGLGGASLRMVDEVVSAARPPTTAPEAWPALW